ncbi:MAG: VPLPA-CTERM sorting domain-containing protein [Tateyamaria sp.]|uniref:VPLPA-CTERM sorting domain-containing protein n=1 Tax=Tateyamaria sp. TaxID=1929288 RepID=UPI00327F3117
MKRLFLSALIAGGLAATSGLAATFNIDFVGAAAGNEQGVEGEALFFSSTGYAGTTAGAGLLSVTGTANTTYNAYLDDLSGGKPAGMGVCKILNSNDQCNPAGDDNIQQGERLTLTFGSAVKNLTDFVFHDANHNALAGSALEFQYRERINGSPNPDWVTTSFAGIGTIAGPIDGLRFKTKGSTHTPFYVSSFTVSTVPVPAALPLILVGMGGFAFMARRKRKSA